MNRLTTLTLAVGLAIALVPGFASAANKCADPHGSIEQRACTMAAAGPDALRRFIQRTRAIYQLYYPDYAPRER
ncbi:MAG TPA: hypothetical protein VMV45_15340 [Casimicrobiaceae bacterium]|nr:hypothetical protein [Casimicrobiaceae bacterium]